MNGEGYRDPTADKAVHRASKVPKHVRDVIQVLRLVASLTGFKIDHIVLSDKSTGRKYD